MIAGWSDSGAGEVQTSELARFPCAFHGTIAHLIPLVEQLHFLELLERFAERSLGVFELDPELLGGAAQIVPAVHRRFGIGRVGEMRRVADAGALLLGGDFAI